MRSPSSSAIRKTRSALIYRNAIIRRNASTSEPIPIAPPVQRKRHRFRNFLLLTTLLTGTVYGGGAYASTRNDRARDIFSQTLPGAPLILDYLDESSLEQLGAQKGKSRAVTDEALAKSREAARRAAVEARERKEKVRLAQEKTKAEEAASLAKTKVEEKTQDVKTAAAETATTVSEKAEQAKEIVVAKATEVKEAVKEAAETVSEKVTKVEEKLPNTVTPRRAGPRELDPTPQPPIIPAGQPYTGPPLPIGSEPPPGYYLAKPKKAAPAEKPAQPEPLPLIAPAVSDLSAQEPVLGQIASTIDSLASFLKLNPTAINNDGPIKEVLRVAELDLHNLGERLETVKKTEHKLLEERLEAQKQEYQSQMETKEKELWDKLEAQEEDWKSAFDVERKELAGAYRSKLEAELDTQKEIINQRLREEVIAQGIEMQRRWLRDIKMRVEKERGGRLSRLQELQGSIKSLEKITLDNDEYLSESLKVNTLWSAIRAAHSAEGRPFADELRALKEISSGDETLQAALSSIPAEVASTGIASLSNLSAWFTTKLAPRIKLAALMPENGGAASYAASAILSPLLFSRSSYSEGSDVMSVLSRADWYLNRKDLDAAAREINQLTGWPKILARDWLAAARQHLEVKQALDIMETEGKLRGFAVL